jgi:TPR repeat protein
VYDACKSTWAIESLLLKAFPEKVVVDPVEALSMGNFFRFYETSFYWNQFNNNGPDLTEPHFLAKQTQQLESSTRQMRAAWEDDSLHKKDGWERAPTNKLAIVHAMGYGVPKDAALAVKLFKRVAAHSYIAQYNLGIMYLKGWGIAKNEAEAVEWFKTATMTCPECTMARNNLGVMYAQGIGVAKDESKAIKLFNEINNLQKKQLHICNLKTIRNLGFMYENGLGVAKDASKAYGYYYAAARFGDIEAQKSKDMLRPQLTIDQIASVLTTPEFQFSECNPLWSGGWHDQP